LNPLKDKTILIGITGGIAAFKVPILIRRLKKESASLKVKVVMTENAKKFVSPLVISTISDGYTESLWEKEVPHISLSEESSLFCVIPADYNIIGKVASGIADDLLSTTISAFDRRIMFFPSMNYRMYDNPVFRENINKLKNFGHIIIEPETGELACDEEGKGRLPDISRIIIEIERALTPDLFKGLNCLVTGGGTEERIDPIRVITNRASGKMAYSLAKYCYLSGGNTELIMAMTSIDYSDSLPYNLVRVSDTEEMEKEIVKRWDKLDYLFMSAAVSDFIPSRVSKKKIKKKEDLNIKLKRNTDILMNLKKMKKNQFVVGFSIETDDLLKEAKKKMREKKLDMIIANDISAIGSDKTSGFIVSKDKEEKFECTKDELSWRIIKEISSKKL
jgi:phosphopantothenoylcysteine decarboxylase/phosphopantothenate--cysteine ligase